MDAITEKTKIPLFAVFSALIPLIGGIVWLSVIYSKVEAHTESISDFKIQQVKEVEMLQEIKERVIRIEVSIKKGER